MTKYCFCKDVMLKQTIQSRCWQCGIPIFSVYKNKKTCSESCRHRAYRLKLKGEEFYPYKPKKKKYIIPDYVWSEYL